MSFCNDNHEHKSQVAIRQITAEVTKLTPLLGPEFRNLPAIVLHLILIQCGQQPLFFKLEQIGSNILGMLVHEFALV